MRLPDNPVESLSDNLFGRRVALHLRVGRVGHEQEHALLGQARQRREVGALAVYRRMVDLEVARVDDQAQRSADRDAHRVRNGVAHPEELDVESPDFESGIWFDHVQPSVLQPAVLSQLDADEPVRQPGSVHRDVELGENVGQGADMVLVTVGDQDRPHPVAVLPQVGDVRDYEVDPGHTFLGKQDPRVDDDDVATALQGHHVLAYLSQPSQGDDSDS